jgi:hypothetical protein
MVRNLIVAVATTALMMLSPPCMAVVDVVALDRDHEALIVTALNARAMDSSISSAERAHAVEGILLAMHPHSPGSLFQGAPWARTSLVHQTGGCFGICVGIGSGANPTQSGFGFALFPDQQGGSARHVFLVFNGRVSTTEMMAYLNGEPGSSIDLIGVVLDDNFHDCFAYYFASRDGNYFQPADGFPYGCIDPDRFPGS